MVEYVIKVCAIEDKTAVVVVALYRSVTRNPVRFKALKVVNSPPYTGSGKIRGVSADRAINSFKFICSVVL